MDCGGVHDGGFRWGDDCVECGGQTGKRGEAGGGGWDFVTWGLLGMTVGVTLAFQREAFRWPMVGVVAASFAGGLLAVLAAKERRGE